MTSTPVGRALRGLVLLLVVLLTVTLTTAGGTLPPPGAADPADGKRTPLAEIAKTPEPQVPEQNWQVDARGSFTDKIPLAVPAFRDLTPPLALRYDSAGGNGWAGVGWSLDGVSEIERAGTGRGTPKYDATDGYLLDGTELIACGAGSVSPSCTTGGTHSTKTESYAKLTLTGTGSAARWTVVGKDGTKRLFAPVHPAGADLVFRWGLSQIIDPSGNTVTYTWSNNQLDTIAYNGTTVKFAYETRSDAEQKAIGNGALLTIATRLKSVDVTVSGNRVRAYKLSYTTSTATSRSLLASVQQFGKDAVLDPTGTVTGGTSLPAVTTGYQAGAPAFASGSNTTLPAKANTRYLPMDINGDGRSDMLELYPGWTTFERHSWLSDGTGFTLASNDVPGIPIKTDTRFLTADANADGKTDLIELYQNGFNWGRRLWLSTGTGFALASTGTSVGNNSADSRFLAMDVSGDGKSDVVELYRCGFIPVHYCRATWLSNGTGFTKVADDPGIGFGADRQFLSADVNGDGRSDLIEIYSAGFGAGGRHIWLSNGTGFVSGAVDTGMQFSTPEADGAGSRFLAMDLNGDARTDMVELYPYFGMYTRRTWISTGYGFTLGSTDGEMPNSSNSRQLVADLNGDQRDDLIELSPYGLSTRRRIWLSTGAGFTSGPTDTSIGSFSCSKGSCSSEFLGMDVNGDGLDEMTELYNTNFGFNKGRHVWNIGGAVADLLTSRTDSWGATMAVGYTPSSAWPNTNNPPLTQTASKVVVGDGRGATATTGYSFAGGAYDRVERQALGFRLQKETRPCIAGETTCPSVETSYRQDLGAVGEPERVDRRTGAGALLSSTIHEYTTNGTTVPRTALLTGTWESSYLGSGADCPGADCKRSYTSQQYNAYGEVTQLVEHGDREVTGDERTTVTTFIPNTEAYLVAKPAGMKTFQGVGTTGSKLSESIAYYDGATTPNQPPTKGLETRSGQWLSTTDSFVDTRKEYDTWGNVTAEINALGARTTLGWDQTYHLYQTSETNALNQQVTAAWDASCGQPTQLRNTNGQTTTVSYDALCRRTELKEPGGKFERYSWANLGNATTQYEQIERPAADGTSSPLWSRRYVDGLQRDWRTVEKGPDAATGDIYTDISYNQRGQVASKTAPYYWVSGQPQPAAHPTANSYDALDRLVKVTMPGGATQTKSYGLWSTTSVDERGTATTDRLDAYSKRVAHQQLIGGTTRTTTYLYDGRGNLARSTDPAGNVTAYLTDSLNRQTQMTDPNSGTTKYEWDVAGRMVAQTDAKNERTTYSYDALDRKTGKTSRAGTAAAVSVSWTYDQARAGFHNVGQVTTATDPAGTKTSDYDAAGHLVRAVRTIHGASYTFRYGFDAGDRALWTTYPDGDTQGTEASPLRYDGAGRLLSIPGFVTATKYDASGELIRLDNANGTVTTRPHDAERGWLTGIKTMAGTTTIQDNTYTRDLKGKITKVSSPFANEAWNYTYDDADQLTGSVNPSSAPSNQALAYDATGNVTSNSRLGSYSYGASRPHAVTSAGSNTYTYDATGLMTSGAGRSLTWDGDNRLASVTKAGKTTTFTYDADGARQQQAEGTTVRRYLGEDYEVDVAADTASKYVKIGGAVVARVDGSTKYWVHTDHQGSIQAETDAAGTEVHRKKYAAYGEVLSAAGPLSYESRGFTGQRHDASGLVYLQARYYDPELGRFISPNPVVDGDDSIGLNRYAYAANDPVNHTDRTGLDCEDGGKKCDRDNVESWKQKYEYSCGPAAVRVALQAQGIEVTEDYLIPELGTTEDGTASVDDTTRVLNQELGTSFYEAKRISHAGPDEINQLKHDVRYDLVRNRTIVANIVGSAQDTDGDWHSYSGGHYVTVIGYDDFGDKVRIADSADVNRVYSYWMSTDKLAVWIAGRGYSG
ncbi:RHS repeat-associated core domain-containing protein [Kribbella sp. CA-293567]|uniref:RHS repeat-associated core domain-containing protein n=1 Tax=Kribbella sp. CA-293567 TaxID=3002436 RepID=UPI0022DCF502|nr:RHS repeat-associated core domain-containing protein [Kribbella sp. CA-293567]WBQ08193.1 SpvB/TcaC N-terminal domain-containing protein [Kribbella sp. CA-293567]